jgi:predicted RNA binding protein YcfA (HicA-like mRNA interferase family)
MPPLPVLSGKALVRILERHGFEQVRMRGDHTRMRHADGRHTTVPLHRELDRGTLKAIMRQAVLSVEDLS